MVYKFGLSLRQRLLRRRRNNGIVNCTFFLLIGYVQIHFSSCKATLHSLLLDINYLVSLLSRTCTLARKSLQTHAKHMHSIPIFVVIFNHAKSLVQNYIFKRLLS